MAIDRDLAEYVRGLVKKAHEKLSQALDVPDEKPVEAEQDTEAGGQGEGGDQEPGEAHPADPSGEAAGA